MVKLSDFLNPDGSTDWPRYEAAQVEAGDRCESCRTYLVDFSDHHGRRRCGGCRGLIEDADEVTHDSQARCPHCGATKDLGRLSSADFDWPNAYGDSEDREIFCATCCNEYTVIITPNLTYTIASPALSKSEEVGA